jgi:hypothetical protein
MKKLQILVTILLSSLSLNLFAQETDKLVVPLTDPNKEAKVHVNIVFGSIKVTGYDGKDIIIEATEMDLSKNGGHNVKVNVNINGQNQDEDTKGMKRLNANKWGFDITAKEVNNLVKINMDYPNQPVAFDIKVPKKCSLKLSTVNNGGIVVENVVGNFEISNVNGNIVLKNIAGSVSANTVNGSIVGTLTSATKTPMAFSNLNGKIDISFPASHEANFKIKSDRGDIFSDFDMDLTAAPSGPKVISDKEKGLYKLNKDSWSYGKINGGGAEIMMKTMNGSIYIRKAK